MSISTFESRQGNLTATPEKVFAFVTDMRNFRQFVPSGTVSDWTADRGSCSFRVPNIGVVSIRLDSKEEYTLVTWKGDALKKEDFTLILHIGRNNDNNAGVRANLSVDMNPVISAIASGPLKRFMEMLVNEMEKFRGWDQVS